MLPMLSSRALWLLLRSRRHQLGVGPLYIPTGRWDTFVLLTSPHAHTLNCSLEAATSMTRSKEYSSLTIDEFRFEMIIYLGNNIWYVPFPGIVKVKPTIPYCVVSIWPDGQAVSIR